MHLFAFLPPPNPSHIITRQGDAAEQGRFDLPSSLQQGLPLILDNSQQFVYLLVGERFQPVYVAIPTTTTTDLQTNQPPKANACLRLLTSVRWRRATPHHQTRVSLTTPLRLRPQPKPMLSDGHCRAHAVESRMVSPLGSGGISGRLLSA